MKTPIEKIECNINKFKLRVSEGSHHNNWISPTKTNKSGIPIFELANDDWCSVRTNSRGELSVFMKNGDYCYQSLKGVELTKGEIFLFQGFYLVKKINGVWRKI